MNEGSEGFASAVASLGLSLLDAKLSVPGARPGAVSRAPLIRTARESHRRVVGVTAPAGYGKSTLLAEWARTEDRPVAWVSLDSFDDDPAALVFSLASAYGRITSDGEALTADVGGLGVSVLGRAAPRLASAFRMSPQPFVLMLDDLHVVRSAACHDALGVAIAGIPPGSQFVAASRDEQPHLPRLRAEGEAMEFGASDLALDAAGARQIFAEAQIELSPPMAEAVTERTEGWPAGLYLASLIANESSDKAPAITGDDRYVADYLYRESFVQQPEDVQRFLRRTAVLDQLCAPLCDALLEGSDGHAQLRRLEASNLFVISLDRRREWYRYHALFREFLLDELDRSEPDIVPKLHLRAADWYESSGSPSLAVEHLLKTAERERAVQLVTSLVLPTYSVGQMSTVQRWLSALDEASIRAYPPLAVLAGWIAILTGRPTEGERWAAVADASSFDQVPLDGSASFNSARAMLRAAMCSAGPEQMMTEARVAVDEEPAWSPWRDTALVLLAEAHLLAGDREQAADLFAETASLGAALGNTDTVVLGGSELASMAMDRQDWMDAAEQLEPALATIDEHRMDDYVVSVLAFAAAARLAVHRGDLEEAARQVAGAMRGRPSCTYALPWLAVRGRLQIAKVAVALADTTTARHLLRETDDILRYRPELGTLVDEVSELREVVASSAPGGAVGGPPLSPAELRLLPYLQTHLTMAEIAGRLFVSHNTVRSQVGSIYRKLGASSRSDAVQLATSVGLLGG